MELLSPKPDDGASRGSGDVAVIFLSVPGNSAALPV
jgi:hypothetical protein